VWTKFMAALNRFMQAVDLENVDLGKTFCYFFFKIFKCLKGFSEAGSNRRC